VLPVKKPVGGSAAVVGPALGPVLDAPALAALSEAEHHDHQGGRDGDTCAVARMLAQAIAGAGMEPAQAASSDATPKDQWALRWE
jgi:hypothetical protein